MFIVLMVETELVFILLIKYHVILLPTVIHGNITTLSLEFRMACFFSPVKSSCVNAGFPIDIAVELRALLNKAHNVAISVDHKLFIKAIIIHPQYI